MWHSRHPPAVSRQLAHASPNQSARSRAAVIILVFWNQGLGKFSHLLRHRYIKVVRGPCWGPSEVSWRQSSGKPFCNSVKMSATISHLSVPDVISSELFFIAIHKIQALSLINNPRKGLSFYGWAVSWGERAVTHSVFRFLIHILCICTPPNLYRCLMPNSRRRNSNSRTLTRGALSSPICYYNCFLAKVELVIGQGSWWLPAPVFSDGSVENWGLWELCVYLFDLKPCLYIRCFFKMPRPLFISEVYIMYKDKYMTSFYFKINPFQD